MPPDPSADDRQQLGYFFICTTCRRPRAGWRGQTECEGCLADANLRAVSDPAMQRRAAEWREARYREARYRVALAEERRGRRLATEQQRHDERAERRWRA